MPTIAKYRKTWFALLKAAPGTEAIDRHDLQEQITGKRSTKDRSEEDWERAIAALQYEAGQIDSPDGPPAICEDRPHGVATEPGTWASRAQARFVGDLEAEIEWDELKRGPVEFLLTTVLKKREKALRRARVRMLQNKALANHTTLPLGEASRCLTRMEASHLIDALKSLKEYHPARCAAS